MQELKFDPEADAHVLDALPKIVDVGNYVFVFEVNSLSCYINIPSPYYLMPEKLIFICSLFCVCTFSILVFYGRLCYMIKSTRKFMPLEVEQRYQFMSRELSKLTMQKLQYWIVILGA